MQTVVFSSVGLGTKLGLMFWGYASNILKSTGLYPLGKPHFHSNLSLGKASPPFKPKALKSGISLTYSTAHPQVYTRVTRLARHSRATRAQLANIYSRASNFLVIGECLASAWRVPRE